MGNSPSKNEPSPTSLSSNQTNNQGNGFTAIGEEEAEDSSALSGLSKLALGNEHKARAIHIRNGIKYDTAVSVNNNNNNHNEDRSFQEARYRYRNEGYAPKYGQSQTADELPLDLEIGIYSAKLMGGQPQVINYGTYPPQGSDLGSSLESERSEISSVSPVFTACGESKDLDSSSSLSSPGSDFVKAEVSKSDFSLATIREHSVEAMQEPKSSKQISVKSKDNSRNQFSFGLSSSIEKIRSRSESGSGVDIDDVIDRLVAVGLKRVKPSRSSRDKLPVSTSEIKYILHKSRSILLSQPTLLRLSPPVKIVGDVHGQFDDLIRIFNNCGFPPYTNYLFLGDYVDRGYKSLETILLLLCYKIRYPENFFMLRGNHESAGITKIYGFYDECKRRLPSSSSGHKLWKVFIDVFNTLPIAATINDKIFCIHGGLSPDLDDLSQIDSIKRPTDIPDKGLLTDLLWSDPDSKVRGNMTNWPKNDRGVSYCFGKKHVDNFCQKFNIDLIVRGHMVVEDGYEFFNKRKLVTVFSAPNYCGDFNNYGAVMSVDKALCCSFELLKPQ